MQRQARSRGAGTRARRHGHPPRASRQRHHARDPGRRGHRHQLRARRLHRVRRPHGRALRRARHQSDRRSRPLCRPRPSGHPHPHRVQHGRPVRVRSRRRAPRHRRHLRGPARGSKRPRPRGRQGHVDRRRPHAAQDHAHHAVVRAGRPGRGGHGLQHRRRTGRRDHDLARDLRPRRDDELPRHPFGREERAWRGARDPQGRQARDRPLRHHRRRPRPERLHRRRRHELPRVQHVPGRPRKAPHGHVRAVAPGLGLAQPAGLPAAARAERRGHQPLHAVHGRLPPAHHRRGRPHGPRPARGRRARARPHSRHPDVHHQRGHVLRRRARHGLHHARQVRGHRPVRGPYELPRRAGLHRRRARREGRQGPV